VVVLVGAPSDDWLGQMTSVSRSTPEYIANMTRASPNSCPKIEGQHVRPAGRA